MKFCTKCGTQNTDESQICVNCQSYFIKPIDTFHQYQSNFTPTFTMNIFGIFSGVTSFILGIITFVLSFLKKDSMYILEKEFEDGDIFEALVEIAHAPVRSLSFGIGSLLMILGLLIVLYYANKIIQKNK